jgi:hypothetical protein
MCAAARPLASPDTSSLTRTRRSRLRGNRGSTYVRANSAASSRVRTLTSRARRRGGSNTKFAIWLNGRWTIAVGARAIPECLPQNLFKARPFQVQLGVSNTSAEMRGHFSPAQVGGGTTRAYQAKRGGGRERPPREAAAPDPNLRSGPFRTDSTGLRSRRCCCRSKDHHRFRRRPCV